MDTEKEYVCNCKKNDDDYIKKLELLAMGTKAQRTQEVVLKYMSVMNSILIICIAVMVIYAINRIHDYMMNTEVVETVETVEEVIKHDNDNIAGGNIINNSNLNNNNIRGNYGTFKNTDNKKD